MEGRGKYWFCAPSTASLLFVGEMKDNAFAGLGKMIYRDGTVYYGTFVINQMSTKRGQVIFPCGSKYKGPIERGQRNGEGEIKHDTWSYSGNF